MNVSGLLDDYGRAEEACGDAENELACNAVTLPTDSSAAIPPQPSASTTAPAMAPDSEEAMESIIEKELDDIVGIYDADDDGDEEDDDESPSSDRNQPSTESSPSSGAGSFFGDLFGK